VLSAAAAVVANSAGGDNAAADGVGPSMDNDDAEVLLAEFAKMVGVS
jgi:hypothetical protein